MGVPPISRGGGAREVRTEGSEGNTKAEMGGTAGTMDRAGRRQTKLEGGWTVDKTQEDEGGKKDEGGTEWRRAKTDGEGWLQGERGATERMEGRGLQRLLVAHAS